ncbi:MAG TPA: OmpA family protein [Elusimicrobiales bacterium]|nr:OmpA family protein [Elusimicrobiales bacterium]
MKVILALCAALLFCGGCSHKLTPAEKEEARRADLELQSVMDLVSKRELPPVEFELGSDQLKESSAPLLDRIYEVMANRPRLKLIVSGHTDDTGSAEFNEDMSMRRAGAVKAYLCAKGIHPDSIRVYGYGGRVPAVKNDSEAARALNRRVEFRITTRGWGSVY